MAKKKKAAGADRLPNRKYVTVSVAAATTTAVVTDFDTMMGAREGAGWLITRLDVQAKLMTAGWVQTAHDLRFQLCTGAQTALLDVDDDEVVATIDVITALATQGGYVFTWPLTWVGPVLVASRKLTCIIDGSTDVAPVQTMDFIFTVWYQWVKLSGREWVEIAEAKGIA